MMADEPNISIRKYIRRGDGPAEEKTSTLVLTTRAKNYVDVRVKLPNDGANPLEPGDIEATEIEWAFAGTSKTTPAIHEAENLTKPAHTTWSHWVDSDTLDKVNDEGDMYLQPDGTVLEKGINIDGSTYEELWQDLDATNTGGDEKHVCFVLKLDEPTKSARGMLIRIGQWIQVVLRVDDHTTVARWMWHMQDGAWKKIFIIGSGESLLPSTASFTASPVDVDQVLAVDDVRWTCIEAFSW